MYKLAFPFLSYSNLLNWYRDASMMSMRQLTYDLTSDEIQNLPRDELQIPITMDDFNASLKKVFKTVSEANVERYTKWMAEFGAQ